MNGLSNVDYSNYMAASQQSAGTSVTTEAMVSRQAQEVQAAMVIAKKFPRDVYAAFERIKKACERRLLAENAVYEYPRGGQKFQVLQFDLLKLWHRTGGTLITESWNSNKKLENLL